MWFCLTDTVEALSQKRDRLHRVVVLTVSGERQLEQQRSQMLFKRESERSDELPFDRCCIEATGAAVKLGIPRQTLESKIRKLGIDRYRFRSS